MVGTIDIDKCELKIRIPIILAAKLHQIAERTMQPARNPPIIGKKIRKEEAPASVAYIITQYAKEMVKDEVLNRKWKKWADFKTSRNKVVRAKFKQTYHKMMAEGTFKRYPRKGSKKWLALQEEKKAKKA